MKTPLLLLAAAVIAAPMPALARACLPYGPLKVTLSGTLESETSSAAPNFADMNRGDPPDAGYSLRLPSPMCVAASKQTDQPAHAEIRELQLLLDRAQSAHLADELGKTVRLTGTLSEGSSGDRHTLRLRVDAIDGD